MTEMDGTDEADSPMGVHLVGGLFFALFSFLLAVAAALTDMGFVTAWFGIASLGMGLLAAVCGLRAVLEGW